MARGKNQFVEVLGMDADDIAPLGTQIWAGLAFDDEARAAFKRDGLMLDGLRLTGPMQFVFTSDGTARICVTVSAGADGDALLDLFRIWLLPRLRAAAAGGEVGGETT
jgi:hypothetical protein